jgi:hypothetical protein
MYIVHKVLIHKEDFSSSWRTMAGIQDLSMKVNHAELPSEL